jgi:hypothetical protein
MNTASSSQASKASGAKRKNTGGNKSTSSKTHKKPTGKKGTPEFEITEENMALYKAIQAKLKAEKKAAAVSNDEGKLFKVTTFCSDS